MSSPLASPITKYRNPFFVHVSELNEAAFAIPDGKLRIAPALWGKINTEISCFRI